ncbi:MAG: UDP-N-acetylmuramate--L-alanine ligase [Ardenticatenia bacterium]|nr:UDP-N-acetylmuramate--L-alanine ligase [Ardenticatenia bacterium]
MTSTAVGQHVHFVGIGGAGLSALARLMLAQGWRVSGSDREAGPRLEALRKAGARVHVGHSADHVADADLVVVSSAVPPDNPEVMAAQERGIPVYKRTQLLPQLTRGFDVIAVAGTHGKTTTTAMIALVLADAGHDPTVVVGGDVPQLGGNARVGRSSYFVLEADEYDYAFVGLEPLVAVVTNVEHDHPDMFADERDVWRLFAHFVSRIRPGGALVACHDDPGARLLTARASGKAVLTYGTEPGVVWQVADVCPNELGGTDFTVLRQGKPVETIRLRVPGHHNVLNAMAAVAVADHLGVALSRAKATLERFAGVARRFELVGRVGHVEIFDDYAHHPTEVEATLQAARQRFGDRPVWVVFQPHTFSRLATMLDRFAAAFTNADRVIVSDVYAAREVNTFGVSAQDLVERLQGPPATYAPTQEVILELLGRELPDDAAVFILGAGDITALGPRLRQALAARSQAGPHVIDTMLGSGGRSKP